MVLPSGHEEYSRLRQMSQPSSEQPSYNPGTSAMQPPASTIGHPPVYSTDWSLRDPSMGYVSAALDPNLTMHTIEPTLPVGQPLVHSTGWPSYGSSMSHASASFETNYNIHTATAGPLPAVNDLYQNYTQSFSTGQSRATEAEFEDHLNPDQTTIQIQSSAPSHSTQERCSPNKLNAKVVNVEATSAHGKVQKKE
ncbi:uncharacterized protein N7479_000595 [Penicillium vulpinum]|uniref:Uncharacterized protein n=1 Tax=Penicillium vulpinum TaxID=29845 RepID=A0A1V6S5M0_9EURO|nr:uncharacterized protein N7479_000595 [Penicillium vulpinum]KAJ5970677.1 hypothetical protein N7479_000595 [Penicillium vulpinum]OQE09158.1 hypothetical protein PENVUL_c007G01956 [Penicillium vulpinum]